MGTKRSIGMATTPTLPPYILRLPVEMLAEISSYITSKRDLRSLCLVSSELRTVALPLLYRHVKLSSLTLDDWLLVQLDEENPGLRHIRTLEVILPSHEIIADDEIDVLGRLLSTIPKDSLENFWLDTRAKVPFRLSLSLLSRQRKLKNFTLHILTGIPELYTFPQADDLEYVTSVQLSLLSSDDCNRGQMLLKRVRKITDLCISFDPSFKTARGSNRSFTAAIEVVLGVTGKQKYWPKPLQLKSLRLENVSFNACTKALPSGVDVTLLESLTFDRCEYTSRFLAGLMQKKHNLVHFVDQRSQRTDSSANDVHQMIASCAALRSVNISTAYLSIPQPCIWLAVRKSAASLRILYADDVQDQLRPFDFTVDAWQKMSEFEEVCKTCSDLEQLAICAPNPDWHGFTFMKLLQCIGHLGNLRTLRLFVCCPIREFEDEDEDDSDADEDDEEEESYISSPSFENAAMTQDFANEMVATLSERCRLLTALVVDVRRPDTTCEGGPVKQHGYVRGTLVDIYGHASVVAVRTPLYKIKTYEPCCEILEDDFRPAAVQ